MLVGLGHVDLVCRDVERSLEFYAAVFGGLGLQPPYEARGERGETIHYLRFPQPGSGSIGLRQALEEQPFERTADVELAYESALAAGAEILHAPRLWPVYHPDYYATFFHDPDGFRIEVTASKDARIVGT